MVRMVVVVVVVVVVLVVFVSAIGVTVGRSAIDAITIAVVRANVHSHHFCRRRIENPWVR